jgi:hypothetical protein
MRVKLFLTLLLVIHALLLGWLAYVHSPTMCETAHLPAGISHWELGRFDLYRVNPPLVRMVAALPVMLDNPRIDWKNYDLNPINRLEYPTGMAFIEANGSDSFWFYTLGRWGCIPFSLIGAYFCFRWAQELYGTSAGFVACLFWCFCPNILGHGALIMPDVPAAALGFAACYAFWGWLKKTTWTNVFTMGVMLGLAELTKSTLILFYLMWPFLLFLYRASAPRQKTTALPSLSNQASNTAQNSTANSTANSALGLSATKFSLLPMGSRRRDYCMLAAAMLLSVFIINFGYCFEGSFQRLRDYSFQSRALSGKSRAELMSSPTGNRFANSWLGAIPVPLPKNYVQGFDTQKIDLEGVGSRKSYLTGTWSDQGWWYFYVVAAALKEPLGVWLSAILAVGTILVGWRSRGEWRDELQLFIPMTVIVFVVSLHTEFTIHFRYIFPAFPFAFVLASRWAANFGKLHWKIVGLGSAATLWMIASSMIVYPHCISYFNELAGGPANGPKYLLESNIDWGQDLLYLNKWIEAHPKARGLRLAFQGAYDPIVISTKPKTAHDAAQNSASDAVPDAVQNPQASSSPFTLMDLDDTSPQPGWFAVCVNYVYDPYGKFAYLRKLEPVDKAGYSIYIYHLTLSEANKIRQEFGMPELPPQTEPSEEMATHQHSSS